MGKTKKSKPSKQTLKPYAKPSKNYASQFESSKSTNPPKNPKPMPATIPFSSTDRILLVGEGDFSFAHSLLTTHKCSAIIATAFDSASVVTSKYSQARSHIGPLEAEEGCKVIYGVDATKLGKSGVSDGGGKEVKKGGFDRIVFNFPHVGGITKDVNRQVRYNQELLVGFFKAATPLLVPEGSIIVTIFEGEPYDLWNVRDLARHIQLKVGRSFRFQASAYPEYKHARTLGDIEGGGGWKGENRPARTYIFEINDGTVQAPPKRKRGQDDDDDSEDD